MSKPCNICEKRRATYKVTISAPTPGFSEVETYLCDRCYVALITQGIETTAIHL